VVSLCDLVESAVVAENCHMDCLGWYEVCLVGARVILREMKFEVRDSGGGWNGCYEDVVRLFWVS